MIRYSKSYWGALTLVRWYGSAFPRALPFSLLSAAAAGLLRHFWASQASDLWLHPYPFQTFAFIVGFMIVFRRASLSLACSCAQHKRRGRGLARTRAPLAPCPP